MQLFSILEYTTLQKNEVLARQAQVSQHNMEQMTKQMQDVAIKTEKETISMRIITVVTLFFLPGTFISTLMSTDVIKYPGNQKAFSPRALGMYLTLTLPIMALTFAASFAIEQYENRRTWLQREKDVEKRPEEMVGKS